MLSFPCFRLRSFHLQCLDCFCLPRASLLADAVTDYCQPRTGNVDRSSGDIVRDITDRRPLSSRVYLGIVGCV